MYTRDEYKLDRLEVANDILVRLEMEYKYAVNKNVDKPEMVKFLSEQLSRLSDKAVLCWNEALNNISDLNLKHPPTIPQIVEEMRILERQVTPAPRLKDGEKPPYATLWTNGDQTIKECFYDTFNYEDVPPATKWVSREYYNELGWSKERIRNTLGGQW
jgi:hypothetical protein